METEEKFAIHAACREGQGEYKQRKKKGRWEGVGGVGWVGVLMGCSAKSRESAQRG